MINILINEEAATKVVAAIENGASEASSTETENAQTSSGQVINNQSCETGHSASENSAGQEEQAQATTDASAVDNSNESASAEPPRKRLVPKYSKEEEEVLKQQSAVVEAEIQRVINDPRYHATPFSGGKNCIINLKDAVADGIEVATPKINRIHGKDKQKTGESIEKYGAQCVLIGITAAMARAVGLEVTSFKSQKGNIDDSAIVIIDGNGRLDYLMNLPIAEWPDLYATFPNPDANGFYNIAKIYEEINTNIKTWGTQDFMQKRLLEEGTSCHKGWEMVNELLRKGYLYQAACETATLNLDRIKKGEILSASGDDVFANYDSAVQIHDSLVKKFGEGEDKILKTKYIPMLVSKLWRDLQRESGNAIATDKFVAFIEQLPDDIVTSMKEAKAYKVDNGKVSKDEHRKAIFENAFKDYFQSEK